MNCNQHTQGNEKSNYGQHQRVCIHSAAATRAVASAAIRFSKVATSSTLAALKTASIMRGISMKPTLSVKNASTAISLAAFSIAGAVPPLDKASKASLRQG